jgi:hypothetical protein
MVFVKPGKNGGTSSVFCFGAGVMALIFSEEMEEQTSLDDKIEKSEVSGTYNTHGEGDHLLIGTYEG